MGYETKIYLAEHFQERWQSKGEFYDQDNPQLADLPDDALINTNFFKIAEIDLCKVSRNDPLHAFFRAGRENQKKRKRYASISYAGFTYVEGEHKGQHDQYSVLLDLYDEPLGVHDPVTTLNLLRASIEEDVSRGEHPYRRFILAEAMLASCVEGKLDPLSRLGAQAERAKVEKKRWLFSSLVVLSFGH